MFKIGQSVVCVRTHSQKVVIEGQIYKVEGNKVCECCGLALVNVGIRSNSPTFRCKCSYTTPTEGIHWIAKALLAPVDEVFGEKSNEEVKEQILEEELV